MAIRQVGTGIPVYSIDVDVPKPTDSRGKGYGSLVTDLKWKLWEEVKESQLQQMKYEMMSKQAQLDVLEQQQRDISRAIRDAREIQSKVKAGTVSSTAGLRLAYDLAKAEAGSTTKTTEPLRSAFGTILKDPETGAERTIETKRETEKDKLRLSPEVRAAIEAQATGDTSGQAEAAATEAAAQRQTLETYIGGLEAKQKEIEKQFQEFVKTGLAPQDLLSRTRGAFATQVGTGGFGISRRPMRQLPSFDEGKTVSVINQTLAKEEDALLAEALRRKNQPILDRIQEIEALGAEGEMSGAALLDLRNKLNTTLTLDEERRVRQLARERLLQQMVTAGAQPTSQAGFLMKDFPTPSALLPREDVNVPTGRIRDDFGVEGGPAPLTREQEVIRDLAKEDTETFARFMPELRDVQATQVASKRVAETPVEYAARRNIELGAMDALEPGMTFDQNFPPTIEDAAAAANQVALDEARLARDRGFQYPTTDISGFRQGVMGRPGGMADRRVVNRLLSQRETPGALPGSGQMESTSPPPVPTPANMSDRRFMGEEASTPKPVQPEIVPEYETSPEKKKKVPSRGELPPMDGEGLPESPYEPQGKLTPPQRRDLYAMKTVKKGLELADKPKQFARVAKTDNPSAAPEYVRIVNGVYEMNSTRPDRFKASYDEVARVYQNDPKNREKALSYLVAKDAIESNVTRPMA